MPALPDWKCTRRTYNSLREDRSTRLRGAVLKTMKGEEGPGPGSPTARNFLFGAFLRSPVQTRPSKGRILFQGKICEAAGADAALELLMFCHYSLQDPKRTLEQARRVRSLIDKCKASDLRFLYTAVAIEGQAHLALAQNDDANRDLEELLEMAERDPDHVPFGDELNLLREIVAHRTCYRYV